MSRGAGWGRKLTLVIVSVAVAILLVEVGLRLAGMAPGLDSQYSYFVPDPDLPYITEPGASFTGTARSGEFDYEYTHNSLGFRDAEVALPKPDGAFRIVALGDSFTYGAGASADGSWPSLLEAMLNEAYPEGPEIEVVNAGVPRFFAKTQRVLFETKTAGFEPDVVIAAFVPNDVMDTYMGVDAIVVDDDGYLKTKEAASLGRLGSWAFLNSAIARLVLRRWIERQRDANLDVDWSATFEDDGPYEESWLEIEAEYSRIAELARARGARFGLLHVPERRETAEKLAVDPAYPSGRLARWAEENGVMFFDALPPFSARWHDETLYWPKDGHCNPAGYELLAATVFGGLMREGVLPGSPTDSIDAETVKTE